MECFVHIIEAPTSQILAHMGLDTGFHNIIISPAAFVVAKIVNEYDQEIPQSQTADNPVAP